MNSPSANPPASPNPNSVVSSTADPDSIEGFYSDYFSLVGESECPAIFHRWCAISAVSALLVRQIWLPFGHSCIYPNMYVMLMGTPGARKNTAINIARNCLARYGFDRFSADRTSKERFIMDLLGGVSAEDGETEEEFLELTLDWVSHRYIVAPEFMDFTGKGNIEFISTLGNLWDNLDAYEHPKLHGKSIRVVKPTVSLLAGNTPQGFILAVPPESMGQGFMSRLILVQGDSTGIKITFPPDVSASAMKKIDERISRIAAEVKGGVSFTQEARRVCDRIYKEFRPLEDFRFQHYSSRRQTHMLKLCMSFAAVRYSTTIESDDVIKANTLLHYTENKMSRALGEYGKSRNSDVANSALEIIKASKTPMTTKRLWKSLSQDLNRQEEMSEILRGLTAAGKIKSVRVADTVGFVPHHEKEVRWDDTLLDKLFLTIEEMV